jgi:hypothetical protein
MRNLLVIDMSMRFAFDIRLKFDALLQLRFRSIKLQSTFLKSLALDSVSLEKGNTELKTLETRSASSLSI